MRRSALLDRAHGMCMSPGVASGARARARSIYARIYTLGLGGLNRSPEASEIREGDAALYSVTSHGTVPRRASFRRANERAVCASLSLRERGARRARTYSHLGCPPFFPSVVLEYVARVMSVAVGSAGPPSFIGSHIMCCCDSASALRCVPCVFPFSIGDSY
jgi:hypothetical protein